MSFVLEMGTRDVTKRRIVALMLIFVVAIIVMGNQSYTREGEISEAPVVIKGEIDRSCRSAKHVVLLLPHVNKAGGRSIEASFDSSFSFPIYRFLNAYPRTRNASIELHMVSGHRSVDALTRRARCRGRGLGGSWQTAMGERMTYAFDGYFCFATQLLDLFQHFIHQLVVSAHIPQR